MTSVILEARELACGYDGRDVLHGIHLQLSAGDFLGVIGPNGSGKSTLIKALTGLLPLSRGQVLLDQRPVAHYSAHELARWIAVVPQLSTPPFAYTVREVIAMGRYPYLRRFGTLRDEDHAAIDEALAATDLRHLQHRPVDKLSGGEYQRATIARALAQRPKILLLDEPTAHLDLGHQLDVYQLLRRLNGEQGLTVLCISHDLNLAAEYCRRLMLFSVGTVYACGTPVEVITAAHLQAAYGTLVRVEANPYSGQPMVLVHSTPPDEEAP